MRFSFSTYFSNQDPAGRKKKQLSEYTVRKVYDYYIVGVGGVRQQPLHGILNGGVSLPRGAERECRRGAERPCRRGQSAHAAQGGGAGG